MTVRWQINTDPESDFVFHPAWNNFCQGINTNNERSLTIDEIGVSLQRRHNARFSNDDPWILEFKTKEDLTFFLLRWL